MTDYAAIRDYYKDLGKPVAKKKTTPPSRGPSKRYQDYLKRQQQAAEQHRAALARGAEARAAALQRRAAAEQVARIAEEKRRTRVERQRAGLEARRSKNRQRRLRHVVTKTDTPESIADKYGVTPQVVGEAAGERLRPGTEIKFDERAIRQQAFGPGAEGTLEEQLEKATTREQRAAIFDKMTNEQWEDIRRQGAGAINPPLEVAADVPGIRGPREEESIGMTDAQRQAALEATTARYQYAANQSYALNELKQEKFLYQVRHESAKNKYQQAREAWMTGDDALRPDYFTDWELSLYSPTVQDRILDELGYRRDKEGKWVPIEFLDEDYGMGGYNFPGYGTGGGIGGGGKLDPLLGKTSTYLGRKSGGRTRRESKQMFAGNIPRAHWRGL